MTGFIGLLFCSVVVAQSVSQKLQTAYRQFAEDSQLKHVISSLYVIDANTGKVVFDVNSQVGLAPASTQKIITAATAFELLGKDFRYKTILSGDNKIANGELTGNLLISGDGDPTLGSERWPGTADSAVLKNIYAVINKSGIQKINGAIRIDDLKFGINPLPDGWIWQDIGNYYGAGARGFNWKENQYDLVLKPGANEGDPTSVIKTNPQVEGYELDNNIKTGAKGSGDNGYIYYAPNSNKGFSTGTIPAGVSSFTISGSLPNPALQFGNSLLNFLKSKGIAVTEGIRLLSEEKSEIKNTSILGSIASPPLDSIIYWFLRKSINLYGEALVKTFAAKQKNEGTTDEGVRIVKKFWKERGIDDDELNMYDGSGLSPLNRVTTHAQVAVLQYARKKDWFPSYLDAFPLYNDMKMKSGTISDVKGFCGYHQSKDGKEYIFSFLVNNYSGKTSGLVKKMYKVLDVLK